MVKLLTMAHIMVKLLTMAHIIVICRFKDIRYTFLLILVELLTITV
jgi:hypothetical protein